MFSWNGQVVGITGATGFVGEHLARGLVRHGANVVALARPTSNVQRLRAAGVACKIASLDRPDELARALDGCAVVFHVAGAVGFDSAWDVYQNVNLQGTRHILDAARRAGVRRFIHTSSIVAVGALEQPTVLDETSPWNLGPMCVPYVSTKRWAEDAARAANGNGLEVVIVNPGCVVGPDDFAGSEFGTLCKRFWKGRIPIHFGGGNNFVDVRDVAEGMRLAAERGRAGERYLLVGENRTYAAFFTDLCRVARRSIPRLLLPSAIAHFFGYLGDRLPRKFGERPYISSAQTALFGRFFYFDASKAKRELGYTARPLAQSLADAHAFWMGAGRKRAIGV